MHMRIKMKLINPKCYPYKAYRGDSGYDLRANIDDKVTIKPMDYVMIPTGIAVEIPEGFEGQIRPRSSYSRKGIIVPIGTVDSGYRGEIKVALYNFNKFEVEIEPFERIAQLVISPVLLTELEAVEELSESERSIKGFGSSGKM